MSEPAMNAKLDQFFPSFNSKDSYFNAGNEPSFPQFSPPMNILSHSLLPPKQEINSRDNLPSKPALNHASLEWDSRTMLRNLSFLEDKIHQVQDTVRSMLNQEGQLSNHANEFVAQQQLVKADLTSIIIQLISTAGALLPNMNALLSTNPVTVPSRLTINDSHHKVENSPREVHKASDCDEIPKGDEMIKCLKSTGTEGSNSFPILEDHEEKDVDDAADGEILTPGTYEVVQLEKDEILAPHTHFCSICGKGFKRDANLRMHMRGHGDEYKTAAALAKPSKEGSSEQTLIRRYSCPFVGCKRNKEHKKFQPLKTILCVKNHYKRTHCDKSYTCSKCHTKKFSVLADLKTHEKHCGEHKWLCSCGTTFSRKDKLFGHVALFQGHTPSLPMDDAKVSGNETQCNEVMKGKAEDMDYCYCEKTSMDFPSLEINGVDESNGCSSPLNFDSCSFGDLDYFPYSTFNVPETPLSYLPFGSTSYIQRTSEN